VNPTDDRLYSMSRPAWRAPKAISPRPWSVIVMRAAMNAIFYLLRTGCPWRCLPRGPFPPRSTVYNIFRKFQHDGGWESLWEELHMALREALDREASPTAAIIDSQSLKAAEKGEPRAGVKKTQWVTTPARR
jgi:transposase